LIFQIAVS